MFKKRSVSLSGHATSVALEPEFWAVLDTAARDKAIPFAQLIARIDAARSATQPSQPLSSACRVFALAYVQNEDGAPLAIIET